MRRSSSEADSPSAGIAAPRYPGPVPDRQQNAVSNSSSSTGNSDSRIARVEATIPAEKAAAIPAVETTSIPVAVKTRRHQNLRQSRGPGQYQCLSRERARLQRSQHSSTICGSSDRPSHLSPDLVIGSQLCMQPPDGVRRQKQMSGLLECGVASAGLESDRVHHA